MVQWQVRVLQPSVGDHKITSIAAAVAVTAAVSAVLERRGYRAGRRKGAVSTHRRERFG